MTQLIRSRPTGADIHNDNFSHTCLGLARYATKDALACCALGTFNHVVKFSTTISDLIRP